MIRSNLKRIEPRSGDLEAAEPRDGERSEPDRGGAAGSRLTDDSAAPDPEVPAKAKRRGFTAAYKQAILAEADACREEGAIGALLRREGLYSSHLTTWRRQREEGTLQALTPKKRGRKPSRNPITEENRQLRAENARLEQRLKRAEIVIDVQKKVSSLLGIALPEIAPGESNS
jgi:transposase-like protein